VDDPARCHTLKKLHFTGFAYVLIGARDDSSCSSSNLASRMVAYVRDGCPRIFTLHPALYADFLPGWPALFGIPPLLDIKTLPTSTSHSFAFALVPQSINPSAIASPTTAAFGARRRLSPSSQLTCVLLMPDCNYELIRFFVWMGSDV